jgi:nitrate/TMAO reductase-like tetraheme cytochrome c subunit
MYHHPHEITYPIKDNVHISFDLKYLFCPLSMDTLEYLNKLRVQLNKRREKRDNLIIILYLKWNDFKFYINYPSEQSHNKLGKSERCHVLKVLRRVKHSQNNTPM